MLCRLLAVVSSLLSYSVLAGGTDVVLVDTLASAVVTADFGIDRNSTQTGLASLDGIRLFNGFAVFSSPDVIKTIQNLPGISSGTELMSGLFVHGGDGTDNLFLLDGVPLYQVSHFAGLFSSFNPDVVDRVDFYKSGFPARYGGRISSVVDVTMRDGDFSCYRGVFSIGLLDGRLQFEGPVVRDRTSFIVSARRSWFDALMIPAFALINRGRASRTSAAYSFYDFNVSMTHRFRHAGALSLRLYMGDDNLRMDKEISKTHYGISEILRGEDRTSGRIRWGNLVSSLSWSGPISENLRNRTMLYYTGYHSRTGISMSLWECDEEDRETVSEMTDRNTCIVSDLGLKSDFMLRCRGNRLRFGALLQRHSYLPANVSCISSSTTFPASDFSYRYLAHEVSLYAEDEVRPCGWFSANAGIRYSLFLIGGHRWHSVEPKVSLGFHSCDRLDIRVSYCEMNQPVHQIASTYFDLPGSCWMPSTMNIKPVRSRQAAVGLHSVFPFGISLDAEGFYKTMDHLLVYAGNGGIFPRLDSWETDCAEGRGLAFGAEAEIAWRTSRAGLSAAYTLSWSLRRFEALWHSWYPDRNDSRHKVTLIGTCRLGDKVEVCCAWHYHTGMRITVPTHSFGDYDLYGSPNNAKLPDYNRLDLGVNIHKTTRRGNESIWNVSIYNVYCRLNPVNGTLDEESGRRHARVYALVPIIPTFSYTLKFRCK